MAQEALQNTARPRFAVRTTAVCHGCFEGNSGTTPGIAREFRPESWLLAGVGGGRWWRASVAGVGGGRRWRASRRSRRRSRTKTPVSLIKATKTRHRSKQRKQRTAHPELTRVINHQTCAYTPHRLQVAREPGRRRRRQRNMMDEGILDGGDMPTGTRTGPQIGSLTRKKRRQRFFPLQEKMRTRANQTQGSRPRPPRRGRIDHTTTLYRHTH